jgi:glycosyltransferase involved in cell wall biosynthesis
LPQQVPRKIAVAANSAGNIVTFRQGLIRALKDRGYEPVIIAPRAAAAEQRMTNLAVEWHSVDLARSGLNPIEDLRLLRSYRRILKSLEPAALLGFTIKPNIYGSIAARSLGVAAIPNISGLGTAFLAGGPLRMLVVVMYRFALKRCETVFFQNPDDLQLFIEQRIVRRSQARLLPGSGIDLGHYAPTPLPAGPPKFLLIARLLRDKGVIEYVEAARILRVEQPGAKFRLLGPIDPGNRTGIKQAELGSWIAEGVIDYLGSADDVRPHIAEASVIVLPSYREGLPRTLLEGAAMARPLITADVPGCREVVENGVNGLLCEVRDARSLADAMRTMVRMTVEERSNMGLASRRLVEERFGEERVVQAYLDALKAVAPPA